MAFKMNIGHRLSVFVSRKIKTMLLDILESSFLAVWIMIFPALLALVGLITIFVDPFHSVVSCRSIMTFFYRLTWGAIRRPITHPILCVAAVTTLALEVHCAIEAWTWINEDPEEFYIYMEYFRHFLFTTCVEGRESRLAFAAGTAMASLGWWCLDGYTARCAFLDRLLPASTSLPKLLDQQIVPGQYPVWLSSASVQEIQRGIPKNDVRYIAAEREMEEHVSLQGETISTKDEEIAGLMEKLREQDEAIAFIRKEYHHQNWMVMAGPRPPSYFLQQAAWPKSDMRRANAVWALRQEEKDLQEAVKVLESKKDHLDEHFSKTSENEYQQIIHDLQCQVGQSTTNYETQAHTAMIQWQEHFAKLQAAIDERDGTILKLRAESQENQKAKDQELQVQTSNSKQTEQISTLQTEIEERDETISMLKTSLDKSRESLKSSHTGHLNVAAFARQKLQAFEEGLRIREEERTTNAPPKFSELMAQVESLKKELEVAKSKTSSLAQEESLQRELKATRAHATEQVNKARQHVATVRSDAAAQVESLKEALAVARADTVAQADTLAKLESLEQQLANAKSDAAAEVDKLKQELATQDDLMETLQDTRAWAQVEHEEMVEILQKELIMAKAKAVANLEVATDPKDAADSKDTADAKVAAELEELKLELASVQENATQRVKELEESLSHTTQGAALRLGELKETLARVEEDAGQRVGSLQEELNSVKESATRQLGELKEALAHANQDATKEVERLQSDLASTKWNATQEVKRLEESLSCTTQEANQAVARLKQELATTRQNATNELKEALGSAAADAAGLVATLRQNILELEVELAEAHGKNGSGGDTDSVQTDPATADSDEAISEQEEIAALRSTLGHFDHAQEQDKKIAQLKAEVNQWVGCSHRQRRQIRALKEQVTDDKQAADKTTVALAEARKSIDSLIDGGAVSSLESELAEAHERINQLTAEGDRLTDSLEVTQDALTRALEQPSSNTDTVSPADLIDPSLGLPMGPMRTEGQFEHEMYGQIDESTYPRLEDLTQEEIMQRTNTHTPQRQIQQGTYGQVGQEAYGQTQQGHRQYADGEEYEYPVPVSQELADEVLASQVPTLAPAADLSWALEDEVDYT